MKYSTEKEQFQTVFGGVLKRKYKCIKSVNVDDEEFEASFDSEGWAPSFDVYVEWDVREAQRPAQRVGTVGHGDVLQASCG